MRDMMKTVEGVKYPSIPDRYAMNMSEWLELLNMCNDGKAPEAIHAAFTYGFVLGSRAQKAGKVTKKL